jgi:hypothetical protein
MNESLGLTSLEMLQKIISYHHTISSVCLIRHEVQLNWGQKYDSTGRILTHFDEALIQEIPLEVKNLSVEMFLALHQSDFLSEGHQVWSFTSRVQLVDGTYRHIPMMNFHPLEQVSLDSITEFVQLSEPAQKGVLLESGRYFHYYGYSLLDQDEWLQFNARFLMPMILVRSRYIGHRLRDGYSTLRLSNDSQYKPLVPHVVRIIDSI